MYERSIFCKWAMKSKLRALHCMARAKSANKTNVDGQVNKVHYEKLSAACETFAMRTSTMRRKDNSIGSNSIKNTQQFVTTKIHQRTISAEVTQSKNVVLLTNILLYPNSVRKIVSNSYLCLFMVCHSLMHLMHCVWCIWFRWMWENVCGSARLTGRTEYTFGLTESTDFPLYIKFRCKLLVLLMKNFP